MELQVVIPCFNEAANLPALIKRCELVHSQSQGKISFILVNNGSLDDSESILASANYDLKAIRAISVFPNRGYGGGILAGLSETTATYVGWTHADLQTPLSDTIRGYELLANQNSFVKGCRKGRRWIDELFTKGMSIFESFLFRKVLTDINAQPTLFHRRQLDFWVSPPIDFSLDLYSLVKAKNAKMSIIRIPVIFEDRIAGNSSWNTGIRSRLRFIKRTINYSFVLKRELT